MNSVKFIVKQLLSKNYLTTCSVVEALEDEQLFNRLRTYSDLDLDNNYDFYRLISDNFLDDLTFSLIIKLSETFIRIASYEAILSFCLNLYNLLPCYLNYIY